VTSSGGGGRIGVAACRPFSGYEPVRGFPTTAAAIPFRRPYRTKAMTGGGGGSAVVDDYRARSIYKCAVAESHADYRGGTDGSRRAVAASFLRCCSSRGCVVLRAQTDADVAPPRES